MAAHWNVTVLGLSRPAVAPMLGTLFAAAIAVNLGQVGFLFLPEKLAPDISRIDPLQGLQKIFSLRNLMRLAFGLFKILVIAIVAGVSLYHRARDDSRPERPGGFADPRYMSQILLGTTMKIGVSLFILAILDYGFQRWKHEQDLRMTSQEMREEMKNLEGNPQMIARRRQVQRQLATQRLSAAVPKADVVITNPTELAVAIQYDPLAMAAPIVVAKGAARLPAHPRVGHAKWHSHRGKEAVGPGGL